ncbi:MAG: FtsW/RodA/SpoVE family cell cycle protein, partial [Thermotaleaceae bacterium]
MNKKIEGFLDEVCMHINCKTVHKDIREELCVHINELKEENINRGYDEERAIDLAISAMGSTDEIGTRLNQQHRPQTEWSLLILTGIISIIGAVIMFSSSKLVDGPGVDFSRYIVFSAIGMGTMIALYFFDYTKFKKIPMLIYISGVLLILVTMGMGIQVNGVKRWLRIGHFAISTPEFASLLFVIAFAGFLEKYSGKGAVNILKLAVQGIFSVILLLLMPSLSTAFVMVILYGVVLIAAILRNHFTGNKKVQLMSLFAGGALPILLFIYRVITDPYKLKRFTVYFSKGKADPLGVGYQQHMADTWLSISKWFGKTEATYNGYGLDMTLPNATGEYILVNIIATLGWAVGILLILLIGIFIVRMFMTTNKIKNRYGFYLSMSACTILSTQFVISILINFNLFPLTAVNMPFVSYSGTGYV